MPRATSWHSWAATRRDVQARLACWTLVRPAMGWIITYGSRAETTVQISVMSEGGSGAPVPDLSVEVDDLDAALARVKKAEVPIEYGPVHEPWGVRRFFVRDPLGKLVNILVHT